jgi:hypothetical protein
MNAMKQFLLVWADGYEAEEVVEIGEDSFSNDNGYSQENIDVIKSLQIGQTIDLSDLGGTHTVKRLENVTK